jgi:hypothetical protein
MAFVASIRDNSAMKYGLPCRPLIPVFASILLGIAARLCAADSPVAILNPKEYTSPSGAYRLRVNPSNRDGAGKATYRLTYNGKEIWSGQRPFTLSSLLAGSEGCRNDSRSCQ